MKKITFCLVLLMLCFTGNVSTQSIPSKDQKFIGAATPPAQRCGTNDYMLQRFADDPSLYQRYLEMQDILYPGDVARINCNASNTINVPLAFHFDNSFNCGDEACILTKIQDAIATLNVDFGSNVSSSNAANCPAAYPDISTGTCITFYLAAPPACSGLDTACDGAITIGQFQGGYSGGGNGAGACWDDYLNIFIQSPQSGNLGVADQIPDALPAGGPGEGVTLGAPYFGGTGGPCAPLDTDGTYGLGKTLAHEIGHYLGLFHSFQGGCGDEPNNTFSGQNITVNDTPAQQSQYFGCPGGCVTSGCGGGSQQTANIMNYTDDACMDMFSEDQAFAMNVVANGLFGGLNIPAANPAQLYGQCNAVCNVVCPGAVTSPYSGSEDLCAALGTYTLPTDFSSVTVDNVTSATFTWSTGNYMSAGGTAVAGSTISLTNPTTCAPVTQTLYLNTGCTDGSIQEINAGTITLTIYPDPTQFAAADLVTFTDGVCGEPTWTSNCASFVTVTQNGGPSFPVTSGAGPVNYDVTLNYPLDCCEIPGGDIILIGTIGSTTLNNGNDTQPCQNGTQPAVWEIPFTIPTAQNATTVNTTGLGSITEVCLDITLNNTDAVNITIDSPDCGAYEWEDLWLGSAFTGGSNTGPITVCFTPSTPNGEFDGTFDGDGNANGNGSFSTCDVNANQWVLYIADYNCYLNGATGGTINSATVSFNDGNQPGQPGLCEFTETANYDCATACANVDLDIQFDGFPAQTSWEILDNTGAVVASGNGSGSLANGTTTQSTCLSDGCYTLNVNDSASNGMCPFQSTASSLGTFITPGTLITPGTIVATLGSVVSPGLCGNFNLSDVNGTTLVSGGNSFGGQSSQQFCLTGGIAPLWHEEDNSTHKRQNESARLDVFPTLAKNNLSVYTSHTTEGQINVVDINGQIVQQHLQRTQNMQLNVSDLPTGIYFIQLVANDTVWVQKFIKQ